MQNAELSFASGLEYFLAPEHKNGRVVYPVDRRASIKDVVEALGVPHTEVGSISVNGDEVDFSHLLRPGDEIEVCPVTPPMNVFKPSLLRPEPLSRLAFAADVNVGKLASLLRLIGLDTAFKNNWSDVRIADLAETEGRVVLSKDRDLLKRKAVTFGRYVRADDPKKQLKEVVDFFGIKGPFEPFTRCLRCNVPLVSVDKQDIIDRLEPLTKKHYDKFSMCPSCGRIYWAGSHYEEMENLLNKLGLPVTGEGR